MFRLIVVALLTATLHATSPNVLFILVDAFGWKDVGYNGSSCDACAHRIQARAGNFKLIRTYHHDDLDDPT
ncbi:MAG: arylsulfatase A-like enzyme [Rhodothermales bacterium]